LLTSKYIRPFIAIAFLAIYVNVLAKNITCNWGHLFAEIGNHHSSHQHDHGSSHHSHSGHSEETGSHSHKGKHDHSKESSKNDGNCCNDAAAQIFKSLSTPSQFDYNFKLVEFQAANAFVLNFLSFVPNTSPVVGNYSLPPPKIPDIRIHIQSFQI
jgi:hypothetical protein